jgi:transposase, IS5 family
VYQKIDPSGTAPESFEFPHGGKLASDNRWVMMAQLIPWSEFETEYAQNFATSMGPPAKSFRMALGALIIKEKLGASDRETVEQIKENPYLQYFIGLSSYSNEIPFDASLLVHFSWDNFNESGDLIAQVEAFKEFTGHYPESVHVDQIYRTIMNP